MNHQTSRRQFIQTLTVAAMAPPKLIGNSPVVDTHLHCFAGKDDVRFPYHPKGPYQPAPVSSPEMLLKLMDGAGVKHAVVVHPEPYQDDHRYLDYCLTVGKGRLKGTCLVFADQPESMKQLPVLAKRGGVSAVRIHAYVPDRLPPFGKPELMRAFWKQATDLGLMVQIHLEPRYAPQFTSYIKEFASTKVIIDHLGRPFQGTPEEHATVVGWAKLPNVVMKLAAIPAQTEYPHRDITATIKQLSDAYGADRMIYGGGFGPTATAESYRAAYQKIRAFLPHFKEEDHAKVLGLNAMKLFRFGS